MSGGDGDPPAAHVPAIGPPPADDANHRRSQGPPEGSSTGGLGGAGSTDLWAGALVAFAQQGGFKEGCSRAADAVMGEMHFRALKDTDEILWYDGGSGTYRKNGEAEIRARLEQNLGPIAKRNTSNEVINHIRSRTYVDRVSLQPPSRLLCLKNGVLDTQTLLLVPHSPDLFFVSALPVNYDPSAEHPRIRKFLFEVVGADNVSLMEEIVGYCLHRGYPLQKAFLFVGEGANGKSTWLAVLRTLLGPANMSSWSLHGLEEVRFATAELYGKLANIQADLPSRRLKNDGIFKRLTGGDPITAERKGQHPFEFVNYAKLIFSANQVPPSGDDSNAFFRRWVIVQFPNAFEGTAANPRLIEVLTTDGELSGLLNAALRGLHRVLKAGAFSVERADTGSIREEYIRRSDPVRAFMESDWVIADPDKYVLAKALFCYYEVYCKVHGLPRPAFKPFTMRLGQLREKLSYPLGRKRLAGDGPNGEKRPVIYEGIDLGREM